MPVNDQKDPHIIEPGMVVEVTQGDLGAHDVTQPKVKDVTKDGEGHITNVIVEKGALFKKDIVVPADRIVQVAPAADGNGSGTLVVAASEEAIDRLGALGEETLPDTSADDILEVT